VNTYCHLRYEPIYISIHNYSEEDDFCPYCGSELEEDVNSLNESEKDMFLPGGIGGWKSLYRTQNHDRHHNHGAGNSWTDEEIEAIYNAGGVILEGEFEEEDEEEKLFPVRFVSEGL
jgi:hypothetical protein